MKNLVNILALITLSALIIIACTEDEARTPEYVDTTLENRDASVWICHKPDGANPHAIWVDANAVEAHLGHGDALLDADGDGYTAFNNCGEGSMDDCDDNDASINPDAVEVCDDQIDNDCDGLMDCDDPDCESECGSACDAEYFCDILHYFDFDEPCPDDQLDEPGNGDAFCTTEIWYMLQDELGWDVKLWDNDYVLNLYCEGSDPDNDTGVLQVIYSRNSITHEMEYRITASLYLWDIYGHAFPPFNIVVDEQTAIEHAQFLYQLAAENGLVDICSTEPGFWD